MTKRKPVETVLESIVRTLISGAWIDVKALIKKVKKDESKVVAFQRQFKRAGKETREFIQEEAKDFPEDFAGLLPE